MAKVLQRLVRTGLLLSTQGTRGGYTLGRVAVVDQRGRRDSGDRRPVTVTACSTEKNDCEQYSKCNIRDPLWQIRERIVAALGTVSLAEMAAEAVEPPPMVTAPVAVMRRANV